MTNSLTEKIIRQRLSHISDPISGKDIVTAGIVSSLVIKDGHVGVMLTIDPMQEQAGVTIQQEVEATLLSMEGIHKVTPVLTAHRQTHRTDAQEQEKKRAVWNTAPLDNVAKVVAVASGKGGVGKSTITALLALSLALQGKRVGIIDADIYGPSIPHMMGLADKGKPELSDGKMIPPATGGVQCMSVGFLLDAGQAAIMRGPMISKTLNQLLRGTAWGEAQAPLDVLLMDMPPGTGDIHLSMVQQVPLFLNGGGAVIVTTPQEIALLDARKCVRMFEKTEVPVLGVIESMSYIEHPDTKEKMRIFGEGGGSKLAYEANVPLLAELAMQPALRAAADAGKLPQYIRMTGALPFAEVIG